MKPVPSAKNPSPISVLLIDDCILFLNLTQEILERNPLLKVVGRAFTGEDAFVEASRKTPWVIVLDLDMQIFSNPQAISYLRSRSPSATIIALTLLPNPDTERLMKKFGVDAVLPKSRVHTDLLPAILNQMDWIQMVQTDPRLHAWLREADTPTRLFESVSAAA